MSGLSLDLDDDALATLVRILVPMVTREVRATLHREKRADAYLTTQQACDYLGVGRTTFYAKVRDRLSVHDNGAGPRYLRSDLDRFRDEQRSER